MCGYRLDAQIDYGADPEAQVRLLAELRRVAEAHPRGVVAKAIGISVRSLYNILKGAVPARATVGRIRQTVAELGLPHG